VPLLAGGPEHPLSSPRVRTWLELPRSSWRNENPERPRFSFVPSPAKEKAFPKTRVLGQFRKSDAVKGRPFEPVDRPPFDAAPRRELPKRRASAGFTFSSRLTLNAWSGD